MLLVLASLMVMGLSPGALTKEYLTSGSYLVHACEAVPIDHPTAEESVRSIACLSYIEGFTDADKTECASVSYAQMASVYVAYMKQHPEVMKMPKSVGLSIALRQSYPCTVESPIK